MLRQVPISIDECDRGHYLTPSTEHLLFSKKALLGGDGCKSIHFAAKVSGWITTTAIVVSSINARVPLIVDPLGDIVVLIGSETFDEVSCSEDGPSLKGIESVRV